MEWHRVVHLGADTSLRHERAHAVAVRNPDDVLVEDVRTAGRDHRPRDLVASPLDAMSASYRAAFSRRIAVHCGRCGSLTRKTAACSASIRKFAPMRLWKYFGLGAVIAQQPELVREPRIVRRNQPRIAEGAEVLAGKE